MTRIQANLLLVFIAFIWGSAFVAQSHGMDHIGPMMFTGVRFLIGAMVVLPLALREHTALSRRGAAPTASDWRHIVLLGGLMLMGAALQQIGIVSTSITNAGFLTALYVPLVPLLGWLMLRQLPHWSVWPGAVACVVGAFLLSGAHELRLSLGDAWVLASTLPWALHVLFVGRWADRMNAPFTVACGQFFVCGVLALAWALWAEPWSWAGLQAASGAILYAGVLSVGVAFTAQVLAQRHAQASDAAIILSSEMVFAAVFGYVLMGDRLSPMGWLGCGLILVSLLAVQLLPARRVATPPPTGHP
ncbi:DMT family transporter [Roseateles sp. BYS180W]|uniref:DMT family transporter n=1 Tax=Roseateles rivi TaxID=3299028 RepID=A0ABW7FZC7_9BURK